MTVKEMMLKLLADAEAENDSPDIDFCDDYDESAYCAYCGNHWTQEAEEKYKIAFGLECEDYEEGDDCVIVHCGNDKEVNALANLLYDMAGYGDADEYDRLFPDPEEKPKPEPVRQMFEVVLTDGRVLNANRIDMTTLYRPSPYEIDNPNTGVRMGKTETGFAVHTEDGDCTPVYMDQVVRIIGKE